MLHSCHADFPLLLHDEWSRMSLCQAKILFYPTTGTVTKCYPTCIVLQRISEDYYCTILRRLCLTV